MHRNRSGHDPRESSGRHRKDGFGGANDGNPAGKGGRLGAEEIDIIAPAIKTRREDGVNASQARTGEMVFMAARKGAVVARCHDQDLIQVKCPGAANGVNVPLGLPFVRTSPDDGTAFDIAGKAFADAGSPAAIRFARRLAATRRHKEEAA